MASKKLHKYCRIFQWVETKDGAFATAIRDLCMESNLSGRQTGVTFLFPPEALRKQIVKDAYSKEPEKAVQLIRAHVVTTAALTGNDFSKGVGTRLGIKLEVEDHGPSTVTLKNGAKLKLADDFTALGRDNLAVWVVESGEVPLEGPKFGVAAFSRDKPRRNAAATAQGGAHNLNDRERLATAVEDAFSACMKKDRCVIRADPYLTHVVSLLNFLKMNHLDEFVKILPMIDRDPAVTFYLLLEPYRLEPPYVLDNSVLFGQSGWNGAEIYEGMVWSSKAF